MISRYIKIFSRRLLWEFFHPVILLSEIEFNDDQLFGIFVHEVSHFRFRHQIIKLIAEFIRVFFWWNPIFHALSGEVAHALEMHADKMVYTRLAPNQRIEYCRGITKVLENLC